jgi:hypothetical protein
MRRSRPVSQRINWSHLLPKGRRAEHVTSEDQVYGYIPQPICAALPFWHAVIAIATAPDC